MCPNGITTMIGRQNMQTESHPQTPPHRPPRPRNPIENRATFGGGVTHVYSTVRAFLDLNTYSGTGQCWGDFVNGGKCSLVSCNEVTQVYSTGSAILALNTDAGKSHFWGYYWIDTGIML